MRETIVKEIDTLAKKLLVADGNFNTSSMKKALMELYDKMVALELEEQNNAVQEKPEYTASMDSKSYRENNWFKDPKPVPAPENQEEITEPAIEKIKDIVAQMPAQSQEVDALLDAILPPKKYLKNDIEEFAKNYQQTPTFERKTPPETVSLEQKHPAKGGKTPSNTEKLLKDKKISEKPKSINDAIKGSLKIGLNDRLAFIKHLFDGSVDDYQRVLSQLNTLETFEEADTFINGKVKPDYNNWEDKEEYKERFMNVVEKRFN